jgi:hypothetical protein
MSRERRMGFPIRRVSNHYLDRRKSREQTMSRYRYLSAAVIVTSAMAGYPGKQFIAASSDRDSLSGAACFHVSRSQQVIGPNTVKS